MLRPTKEQIDEQIVDLAAALFARHGFKQTPIQAIADAAGYSKAGLLNHFPSKEALQDAVIERCVSGAHNVLAKVEHLFPSPERDLAAITAVVDFSAELPGCLSLMLSSIGPLSDAEAASRLEPVKWMFLGAFGVHENSDQERLVRVGSALGALTVTSLGVQEDKDTNLGDVRHLVIQASYDALGHYASTSIDEN